MTYKVCYCVGTGAVTNEACVCFNTGTMTYKTCKTYLPVFVLVNDLSGMC